MDNIEMIVRKVFVNERGEYGNPVGIVLDIGLLLDVTKRQSIATFSGFSEVVFINNLEEPNISIYTPQNEIMFAGHAVIGAVQYIIDYKGISITEVGCLNNIIKCYIKGNMIWVEAKVETLPPWNIEFVESVNEIEDLTPEKCKDRSHTFIWSWINENEGVVRARTFASDWDIPEDEANGSGSMALAHQLNRSLKVIHGKGSVILTVPVGEQLVTVGGLVSRQ